MMTAKECRKAAANALSGHWAPAVLATLIILVIAVLLTAPNTVDSAQLVHIPYALIGGASLLTLLILMPLEVGYANAFRVLYQKGDDSIIGNSFKLGFNNYWHILWGMILMAIKIWLWALLFIIPGIIKAYSYAMTPFILVDHPEISISEAIQQSRLMMKGHKFDLFYLQLTFIGWGLLCLLTAGIGFLWLTPYMQTSTAAFYYDLKNNEGILEATLVE